MYRVRVAARIAHYSRTDPAHAAGADHARKLYAEHHGAAVTIPGLLLLLGTLLATILCRITSWIFRMHYDNFLVINALVLPILLLFPMTALTDCAFV